MQWKKGCFPHFLVHTNDYCHSVRMPFEQLTTATHHAHIGSDSLHAQISSLGFIFLENLTFLDWR